MKKPKRRSNDSKPMSSAAATDLAKVIGGAGWNTGGPHPPPQPGG